MKMKMNHCKEAIFFQNCELQDICFHITIGTNVTHRMIVVPKGDF